MSSQTLRERVPVLRGAAVGVAAYLLGYLLTYLLVADSIRDSLASRVVEFVTGDPGTWKLVGWVFYNAHFVTANVPGLFGGTTAVNFVDRIDAFPALLYVLPPLFLVLAGVGLARLVAAETPTAGAKAGLAVAAGYFPLAVAGAFVFVLSVGDATAGPDRVTAVLLAGAVYPLVFGALGGAVGGALD